MKGKYTLGSIAASEQLIRDLYIDLRRKVRLWADVTKQTAQARMGYIGQHLTSVVTGYPGGRTGARGRDLILPKREFAEIKTCYRVDQLGACLECKSRVASIEIKCSVCGSSEIKRNDDSKWLIGIRNAQEFLEILEPKFYFLVLFDFCNIHSDDTTIQASIWRVDPKAPGFSCCMVDYYLNIQAKSRSKAPFNLWPYQLKFILMRPLLIYRSLIKPDDSIKTLIFPGRDKPKPTTLLPLIEYTRSTNFTFEKIIAAGKFLGVNLRVEGDKSKKLALEELQVKIQEGQFSSNDVIDAIAKALYLQDIRSHFSVLDPRIKKFIPTI